MAEMVNVNDFRPGTTFIREGQVFVVIEANHSKSGRGQAHVKTKARNLETGSTTIITYIGGDKVEKAFVERKPMQFLFQDGNNAEFMDNSTFEQVSIPVKNISNILKFLKEGAEASITIFEGRVLGVETTKNVVLRVTHTTDAVKGDTVTNASKKATLETGIEIDVPQFINIDEEIIVSTEDEKYVSKA